MQPGAKRLNRCPSGSDNRVREHADIAATVVEWLSDGPKSNGGPAALETGALDKQLGKRRALVAFLIVTILLGATFLGVKAVEYHHKFEEHLFPGSGFHFEGSDPAHSQMFFFIYAGMLYLVITIGLTWIFRGIERWLRIDAARAR